MGGVLNVGVVHGNNNVVFLNTGRLGRFHHIPYRHPPPGSVLHRDHMNAHLRERQGLAVQGGRDDPFSQKGWNGKGHTTAMRRRIIAFCLNDRVHDTDDVTLVVEEAASGVAAAGRDISLNQAGINRLKKRVGVAEVSERHGRAPAHGIPDGEDILAGLHVAGSK